MVTMLWRSEGSPTATKTLPTRADSNQVSGYAQDAMAWAVANDIIKGHEDGSLDPQGKASREQVAQVMMNLITGKAKALQ